MSARTVRALMSGHQREDAEQDRRLMAAVRVGVNGSPEAVRDFLRSADQPRGREMTLEEARERARELREEADGADGTSDPPEG